MTTNPLVSVMISTHNRAGYLREAAASVLAQTFTGFELILCDDASSDETPAVCLELERADSRIRTLRHERNVGMVQNWNSGLAASRGRYFCKLDDDNRYLETFLEKTVQALQETPDAAFAFTDEWFIDADGKRDQAVTEASSRRYGRTGLAGGRCADTALLAAQQSAGINASLFVRESLAAVGGFRLLGETIGDLDVFLNLASHGSVACYVPERLAEYRIHTGMGTHDLKTNTDKVRTAIRIWEAHQYQGAAEEVRQQKLAQSYISLGRTLLLNRNVQSARHAIRHSLTLERSAKTQALASFLALPEPLIQYGLRQRYGGAASRKGPKMLEKLSGAVQKRLRARSIGVTLWRSEDFALPESILLNGKRVPVQFPSELGVKAAFAELLFGDCYDLENVTSPTATVLDIGGNVGIFALAARKAFPGAVIHSYEPNPNLEKYLKVQASAASSRCFMEAVETEDGFVSLEFETESVRTVSHVTESSAIPATAFRKTIERLGGKVDFAKVDCEGAEWHLWQDHAAWQNVWHLAAEYHLFSGHTHEEAHAAVTNLGFQVLKQERDEAVGLIHATRIKK